MLAMLLLTRVPKNIEDVNLLGDNAKQGLHLSIM